MWVVEFTPTASATATETIEGVVEQATSAEIYAAAVGAKAIMAQDLETASALVAAADAATIAFDWAAGINRTVTLTANRVLRNPTGGQPGTWRTLYAIGNDGTDRTLTFGNQFLGEVPALTDIDSARAYLLTIYCLTATHFVVSAKGRSADRFMASAETRDHPAGTGDEAGRFSAGHVSGRCDRGGGRRPCDVASQSGSTSTSGSVTGPPDIVAGDLLVYADSAGTWLSTPAAVPPSGFTIS